MSNDEREMTDKVNSTTEQRVDAPIQDDMRDVKSTNEVRQVTQFVDEEEVIKSDYNQIVKKPANPYIIQDLSGFLMRPYPVATIAWKKSAKRGSCIGRYVFPDMSFKLVPIWQKLQQFQFFRAGMCFTIKVNASTYHYGKLLCVWRPLALGKTSNDIVLGGPAAAYDNLYTLSSYPHVIIDANGCESNDFYVDYSLPYEWIDLSVWSDYNPTRKMMNLGILEFWVLNPLYAMGQPTDPDAVITLFASFTDPEVSGYTSVQHTYTDIGFYNGYKTNLMPTTFSYAPLEDVAKVPVSSTSTRVPAPSTSTKLPKAQADLEPILEDEETEDSGYDSDDRERMEAEIIEKVIAILNKQASAIDIPNASAPEDKSMLRRIGSCFQKVLKKTSLPCIQAGNDAGNNDMNVKPGLYKVSQYPIQVASTHVDHAAIPMALSQKVGCKDSRGTSENGIRSFLSKPCLLHQFEITKTTKWGSTLTFIPVSPAWYPVGTVENVAKPIKYLTRVAMYSRLFTMWRGSLRYHFNVVCSRFHSLRLRVYWMPGPEAEHDKIFMANSAVNKIVDIQGCTDFIVDVPWLNRLASLRYDESDDSNNGILYVDLMNPVVYPEANMPPVQVNVWISAGPDFEVELLKKNPTYMSMLSWNKAAKGEYIKKQEGTAEKKGPKAQSGDEVASGVIQGQESKPEISQFSGEKAMTIQDIITKPTPFMKFTLAQNEISYVPNSREAILHSSTLFYNNNTIYDYFSTAFGAVSGAVRFHAMNLKGGSIGFIPEVASAISFYRGKSGVTSLDDFLEQYGYTSVVVFDSSVSQRTVTLPYYSNCKYIPTTVVGAGGPIPQDLMFPLARINVFAPGDGAVLYASATENFYFHLPCGVPAMVD